MAQFLGTRITKKHYLTEPKKRGETMATDETNCSDTAIQKLLGKLESTDPELRSEIESYIAKEIELRRNVEAQLAACQLQHPSRNRRPPKPPAPAARSILLSFLLSFRAKSRNLNQKSSTPLSYCLPQKITSPSVLA